MSQSHTVLIISLLLLIVNGGFTASQAGGITQGCQPLPHSCYAPKPGACVPAQQNRCLNVPPTPSFNSRPLKVGSCEPKPVPLTYREEGPVRSLVINAVGLLKATIQLPFNAVEAILPIARSQNCAPTINRPGIPCNGGFTNYFQAPGHKNPRGQGYCQLTSVPACGFQPLVCAPPGPVVGPLPRQVMSASCGPQLPPQIVQEHRLPAVEPNNLLQGILNLPGAIVQNGRLFGDLFGDGSNAPYSSGPYTRP